MRMHKLCAVLALAIAGTAAARDAHSVRASAVAVLDQAIAAQGGGSALESIAVVSLRAQGYRNMLEQSERPEGPYIVEYNTLDEIHDHAQQRFRSFTQSDVPPSFTYVQGVVADRGAAMRVINSAQSAWDANALDAAREALLLSPEQLLLTARGAADVRLGMPTVLQGVPQDVVDFSVDGAPAHLFLNRFTHLPTALDYSGALARNGYWSRLGDVTMRVFYSQWALGPHAVRLPMQWDTYRNGLHDSTYAVRALAINAEPPASDLAIPPAIRASFAAMVAKPTNVVLGRPDQPAIEVAKGVTLIPGSWNVTIVRQDDGVVVIEAPISSAYSEKVMAEIARRYPGVPIKAVVSTSDSWPHIAGLRPYVARGIPVYGLALNRPILGGLVNAPYTSKPDALQRRPRVMRFVPIGDRLTLGSGANTMTLYPLQGETSERQMMVYLPGARLLYGSDPFQSLSNSAEPVAELASAVRREGLAPVQFYMMHILPTPWADLVRATRDPANSVFPTMSAK